MPKIMAEANRADGFRVLSLGYAEGPESSMLKETLLGKSTVGMSSLLTDIEEAQDIAGFSHYITDASITLVNDFVKENTEETDTAAPVWSSVYNTSSTWPADSPEPRIGVQKAEVASQSVVLSWDVALDRNRVRYVAYYQTSPFDFENDPELTGATRIYLNPEVGEGYENGAASDVYPYQAAVSGLTAGQTYYFVIRAVDCSPARNEDANQVYLKAVPNS